MLYIHKPIGIPRGGGETIFDKEYFLNPIRRPLSGAVLEDYEELAEASGDKVVFKIPDQPWLEGIQAGTQWIVEVFDDVSGEFIEQELIQVQKTNGAVELFIALKSPSKLPEVENLPPALTIGGRVLTSGGREIRR